MRKWKLGMGVAVTISFLPTASAVSMREACLGSQRGWSKTLQRRLNLAKNPLADHVRRLNWQAYCDCYGPELETIARAGGGSDPKARAEFEQKDAQAAVTCAQKAGLGVAPAVSTSPLPKTEFFASYETMCAGNSTGQIILIETQLKSVEDPRASRVRSLNLARYCSCYTASLRREAGDDLAQRGLELSPKRPLQPQELMKYSEASDQAKETCAREQLPYHSAEASAPPGETAGFKKVFESDFTLGRGLGGIYVGLPKPRLLEILGPTNAVQSSKDYEEFRYGPSLLELVVRVAPPGADGTVQSIRVNRFYRGSAGGIRVGDTFEKVKARMAPEKPAYEDRHMGSLIYKSGSQFYFNDYGGGILQGIGAFDPKTHPLLKGR